MSDKESEIKSGWEKLKQLITLKYEYSKLTVAERLTMILAYVAIALLGILMGMGMIFFASVALARWIGDSIGMVWGNLIVAGIYMVILLVILALRKRLIINPISRFITKMMF
jgi:hypothetical protein